MAVTREETQAERYEKSLRGEDVGDPMEQFGVMAFPKRILSYYSVTRDSLSNLNQPGGYKTLDLDDLGDAPRIGALVDFEALKQVQLSLQRSAPTARRRRSWRWRQRRRRRRRRPQRR